MRPHLFQRRQNSRFYFPPLYPALTLNADHRYALQEVGFHDGLEIIRQFFQGGCNRIGGIDDHAEYVAGSSPAHRRLASLKQRTEPRGIH